MNFGLPCDLTWYKLLTDWGSLFGGGAAVLAGVIAYLAGVHQASATLQAADKQIAVNAKKDRLQAHCLAVGIYPELLAISVSRERASAIIQNEFPKVRNALTTQIVALIRDTQVVVPPLLSRSVDHLYILEEAGATILQLLSVILQYNYIIDTLAKQILDDVNSFSSSSPKANPVANLSGHLQMIGQLVERAEEEIKPIHDGSAVK